MVIFALVTVCARSRSFNTICVGARRTCRPLDERALSRSFTGDLVVCYSRSRPVCAAFDRCAGCFRTDWIGVDAKIVVLVTGRGWIVVHIMVPSWALLAAGRTCRGVCASVAVNARGGCPAITVVRTSCAHCARCCASIRVLSDIARRALRTGVPICVGAPRCASSALVGPSRGVPTSRTADTGRCSAAVMVMLARWTAGALAGTFWSVFACCTIGAGLLALQVLVRTEPTIDASRSSSSC